VAGGKGGVMVTREEIIEEIRRIATSNNGKPLGLDAFKRLTGIRESDWRGIFWARWNDALLEAGFPPNDMARKTDDEAVFRALVEVMRQVGKFPTVSEYQLFRRNNGSLPSDRAIYRSRSRRLGVLAGFRDWLSTHPECNDVALYVPQSLRSDPAEVSNATDGFVYLTKSGVHFKVGRSDEIERRVKEIRTALPDKLHWCIQYALMIRPASKATGTVASRTVEQTANGSN
jgi:hypothetical protein